MTQPPNDQLDLSTSPARARGPLQSQAVLDSLGKDDSLKSFVALACLFQPHGVGYHKRMTDDQITQRLEFCTGRRFQRNVVARTRGLLERDNWLTPSGDVIGRTGRPTHTTLPSLKLMRLYRYGTDQ